MKMYEKLQTLAENIKIEEYRLLSLAKTLNKYQSYFTGAIYKDTDINNMVKKLQEIREDLEYTTKYIKSAIEYYNNDKLLNIINKWSSLEND